MKRWVTTWWLLCSVASAPSCAGDDAAGGGRALDAGSTFAVDSALQSEPRGRDSGRNPDGASADSPPTLASATPAACEIEPLPAIGAACSAPDPGEPSSERKPARLSLGSTCSLVTAWAADKDQDAYRFRVEKSDPVLLELSYVASDRAQLSLSLRDQAERELASTDSTQQVPVERQSTVFQGSAGASYDLVVAGDRVGVCLPYALRVNPGFCSDAHEDNDSESSATELSPTVGAAVDTALRVQGTSSEGDMDFFQFVTPKADPVLISGSYTVSGNGTLQLRRRISNTAGLGMVDVAGARVGASETFAHWLLSNSAGALFRVQLWPSGSGCARYQLAFEVAACSDAYEDNDSETAAAAIALGQELTASIFRFDDDYYDLSHAGAAGRCTVRYTLDTEAAQALRLDVYNGSAGTLASSADSTSARGEHSVSVQWQGPASVLVVSAKVANSCQPYTLRCDSVEALPAQ